MSAKAGPTYIVFHLIRDDYWVPTAVLLFPKRSRAKAFVRAHPEDFIIPKREHDKVALCWTLGAVFHEGEEADLHRWSGKLPWPAKPRSDLS